MSTTASQPLISVEDLVIRFVLREGTVEAVNGVTFSIPRGKVVALVGESGCGKSVTARALLGLLPSQAEIPRGRILLAHSNGNAPPIDIVSLPRNGPAIRAIRGRRISMIFQEPMASFSPVHTIGDQIGEVIALHERIPRRKVRERVLEMLRLVSIPMPERRIGSYPHELSGGLRQRAMIAMALACSPELVIADEPTTALDVTIQAQILKLLRDLQERLGMAILIITHDLGVVAQTADEVTIMYLGRIVESSPVEELFIAPRHPYTRGLLASVPRLGQGNAQQLVSIPGSVPGPFTRVSGCPFHPRCPEVIAGVCDRGDAPTLKSVGGGRVACHLYNQPAVSSGFAPGEKRQ